MGYPPPPAGPPPPFPFEAGGDIAAGEALLAAIPARAVAAQKNARVVLLDAARTQRAIIMAPAVAAQAATVQAAANLATANAALIGVHPTSPSYAALLAASAMAAAALGIAEAEAAAANAAAASAVADAEAAAEAALAAIASAEALVAAAKVKAAVLLGTTPGGALTALAHAEILALEEKLAGELAPIEALCAIFEAGLGLGVGGGALGLSASLTAALSAEASAGLTATCCGFTLDVSAGFVINIQIPISLSPSVLLPYLGFRLSCDPSKPINLVAGLPWGGGRISNAEPDPDLDENAW